MDPPKNTLKLKEQNLSTTLLIIGLINYVDNSIKTLQTNKETNFHDLKDPKPGFTNFLDLTFDSTPPPKLKFLFNYNMILHNLFRSV